MLVFLICEEYTNKHKAIGGSMSTNVKEYADSLSELFVLQGLATVVFGVVVLFFPGLTLASLLTWLAVYISVVAVVEMAHGFRDLGRSESWWFSLLVGVVMLGVGAYIVRNPALGLSLDFVWVLGLYALVVGSAVLAYALRVRDLVK